MAIALAFLVVSVVDLPPAHACTCVRGPDDSLRPEVAAADGAMVGRVVSEPPDYGDLGDFPYQLEVLVPVKGVTGPRVRVYETLPGSSCGIGGRTGEVVGLLLHVDGEGRWQSDLCSMADPDDLRAVASKLTPAERAPPVFAVASTSDRLVALDRRARTLHQRPSNGTVEAFDLCSGGRRLAVVTARGDDHEVAVLELPTLRPRWTQRLRSLTFGGAVCLDEGEAVGMVAVDGPEHRVVRVSRQKASDVWTGHATAVTVAEQPEAAFVALSGGVVQRVDFDGTRHDVGRLPVAMGHLAVDRDGEQVAAAGEDGSLWLFSEDVAVPRHLSPSSSSPVRFLRWSSYRLTVGRADRVVETYDPWYGRVSRWTTGADFLNERGSPLRILRDGRELVELDTFEGTEVERFRLADRPLYESLVVVDDGGPSGSSGRKPVTSRAPMQVFAVVALVWALASLRRYAARR